MSLLSLIAKSLLKPLGAMFAALALLLASGEPSDIIGPTMDWKPIWAGAKEFGISDAMIDEILAAGVEIECGANPQDVNYTALNGWFLGSYSGGFFTNAHAVARDGAIKANLAECVVRSLREMERAITAGGASSDAASYPITSDPPSIRSVELDPEEGGVTDDRAYVPLPEPIPGAKRLKYRPMPIFQLGQEVFLVSRQTNALKAEMGGIGPIIQRATVRAPNGASARDPSLIYLDAHTFHGNSAALIFIREPGHPDRLRPIGIHEGSSLQETEYAEWDRETNSAFGVGLDQKFFSMMPL